MKNIKLSVLALTVFVATVASAAEPVTTSAPEVKAPAATQTPEVPKAPEVAPVVATEVESKATVEAQTEAPVVAKPGYFVQAYEATKNGMQKLCSTVKENKLATFGVVVALAAAFAGRKQILAAGKKAWNYAAKNPVTVAAGAAAIAALGFAEYKLGYGAAALNKISSLFASKKATEAIAQAAPEAKKA